MALSRAVLVLCEEELLGNTSGAPQRVSLSYAKTQLHDLRRHSSQQVNGTFFHNKTNHQFWTFCIKNRLFSFFLH